MPKVYISGPITSSGNLTANVRNGIYMMRGLWDRGYWGFCPHLSETVNMVYPMSWEQWLRYDYEILSVCDCMYRLPGYSKGADKEEEWANQLGIPVFRDFDRMEAWKHEVFYGTPKNTYAEVTQ